ncbi:hypothetical protein [Paraburkholderia sp. A3RO-2L]|uniref:hypothetical protein n=1 Tax=Paraburkholderia sp. A3RO-2L TaxID=3028376 RepID=UPI003DA938B6
MVDGETPTKGNLNKHLAPSQPAKPEKHLLDYVAVWVAAFAAAVSAFSALASWYQLQASRDQLAAMKLDQRAWVAVDLSPVGPLDYGEQGWSYTFGYKLSNVGKSPASNVSFLAKMIPLAPPFEHDPGPNGFAFHEPVAKVHSTIEDVCRTSESLARQDGGEVTFPGAEKAGRWRVADRSPGDAYLAGFVIVACVTYKSAGDPSLHRSIRVFELEAHNYGKTIHRDLGIVSQALDFSPYQIDGAKAD